jgi:hypothetical protein
MASAGAPAVIASRAAASSADSLARIVPLIDFICVTLLFAVVVLLVEPALRTRDVTPA